MSDVTLSAAVRSSLLSLQSTTDLIDRTNGRLSSGLRVASAVDDPVAFFSAKSLTDRGFDFSDRKDGIDQGISTVTAALDGVESIDSLVRQLKGIANSLKSATGTQFTDLVSQFQDIRTQIGDLASDAEYQGVNLIDNTSESLTVNFSNNTTSLLNIDAVQLQETGLGIDGLVVRADSQVSFAAFTNDSGLALNNSANIALTAGHSAQTLVSDFGGEIVVTYNGTGTTVTNSGEEITFALNTQYNISVHVGTSDSQTVTQGQTLTLQLATFNVGLLSAVSGIGNTGSFSAANSGSVEGVFIGVLSGLTQSFISATGGNVQILGVNTEGGLQSGVDFVAEGQGEDADTVVTGLDAALTTLRSESQKLGSNVALLQTRLDFTEQYVNTLEEGAGKLTLADLNQEGANLLALQTRQQLGISSLAFAGQSEQGILALFN